MTIKKLLLPLLSILAIVPAQAQSIAISNNALFDAVGALSAGIEMPLSGSTSWELYGSVRPWKRGNNSVHKHLAAQTQLRLWPCQVMNGFYWGPYAHVAQFNIANQGFPLSIFNNLKSNRYEGWLVGGGIGVVRNNFYKIIVTGISDLGNSVIVPEIMRNNDEKQ